MAPSPSCGSRGKRPRTPEALVEETFEHGEQPSPKVPRRPVLKEDPFALDLSCAAGELPFATKLMDYLAPGGTARYRPRPEWYQTCKIKQNHQRDILASKQPQVASSPAPAPASLRRGDQQSLHVAPENGLLPSDTFPDFMLHSTGTVAAEPSPKVATSSLATPPASPKPLKPAIFGKDWDHALHVAVRESATEAAIALLDLGASLDLENARQFTPLILASQKGNARLVRELLRRGADPGRTTLSGVSAVLQAAHFGHVEVLKLLLQAGSQYLIEIANYNHTTPLMRASQEGQLQCVKLLVEAGTQVNRRNRAHMTALMLASQRGHAKVCQLLIDFGAELDAMTNQNSTSLLLACKRGNVDVVRVLVTAGCELSIKNTHGRTVRSVALRSNQKELLELLDPSVQIDLMQRQGRRVRSFEMIRIWNLLQQHRANVLVPDQPAVNIHDIVPFLQQPHLPYAYSLRSTNALLRTMTLPEPLMELIAQFLPLPHLWAKRLGMLTKRAAVHADHTVVGALDLMDEILEEGGFLEACDEAHVTPLPNFESWAQWKAWGRQKGKVRPERDRGPERLDLATAQCPPPHNSSNPTIVELRRHAGFLQILAHRSPLLERVLTKPPYKMPHHLLKKLITVSDLASLTRRMGVRGIHFDTFVAMDLVMLVSQLCSWYWRERDDCF